MLEIIVLLLYRRTSIKRPPREGKGGGNFFFYIYRTKSTSYRFSMFRKNLTRGFSFRFHFLPIVEIQHCRLFVQISEFFCRHVNQDVVLKKPLYCSLKKYYFQLLLHGVLINKKPQPSDFRMLYKTEKEPVYYY